MIRARIWLGTNAQDWYWICLKCSEDWIKGHTLRVHGGIAGSCVAADFKAREHLAIRHNVKAVA